MHPAAFIVLGVFACASIGFVDNITFPGVTLVIEPQDIGLASGVLGSIRACGGAIAQALYVSLLQNKLALYLPEYVTPAALSAGVPSTSLPALFDANAIGNFSSVPNINPELIQTVGVQVTRAYISSFRNQDRVLCDDSLQRAVDLGSLLCAEYGAVPRK